MKTLVGGLIGVQRIAQFSDCLEHRYSLRILWDPTRKPQCFVGLNPSTATHEQDDPTVRRCIDYARRWGAGGLVMCNAFAYRSTDWRALNQVRDPVGSENTVPYLRRIFEECRGLPIAAWGKHANEVGDLRWGDYLTLSLGPLDCLDLNKDGSPKHPLYLSSKLTPMPFNY